MLMCFKMALGWDDVRGEEGQARVRGRMKWSVLTRLGTVLTYVAN